MSVQEQREKLDKLITEYSEKFVPDFPTEEIRNVLNMDYTALASITAQEALAQAFSLKKTILKMHKERNLHMSRIKWARCRINEMLAKSRELFSQFDKFDHRAYILGRTDSYVRDLLKVVEYADGYVSALDGLGEDLRSLSMTLEDIGRNKYRGER